MVVDGRGVVVWEGSDWNKVRSGEVSKGGVEVGDIGVAGSEEGIGEQCWHNSS